MQRTNPAHRPVGIGAPLEEKARERILAGDDRVRQGMGPIHAGGIDGDPGREEDLGHRDVPVVRGVEQRREAVRRRGLQVGVVLDQHPDNGRMPVPRPPTSVPCYAFRSSSR